MRGYELMYILDPTLDEDGLKETVAKVDGFMTQEGISVEKTENWGKRRLAYKVGKHGDGNYMLSLIKAEPQEVAELERRLRVTDAVLRFITVRRDEQQEMLDRRRARKAAREEARRLRRQARSPREPASPLPSPADRPASVGPTPVEPETTAKAEVAPEEVVSPANPPASDKAGAPEEVS